MAPGPCPISVTSYTKCSVGWRVLALAVQLRVQALVRRIVLFGVTASATKGEQPARMLRAPHVLRLLTWQRFFPRPPRGPLGLGG
jgi:hypothetical protein